MSGRTLAPDRRKNKDGSEPSSASASRVRFGGIKSECTNTLTQSNPWEMVAGKPWSLSQAALPPDFTRTLSLRCPVVRNCI